MYCFVYFTGNEKILHKFLFGDYNPKVRPVVNVSNTINVEISMSLSQIKNLVSV